MIPTESSKNESKALKPEFNSENLEQEKGAFESKAVEKQHENSEFDSSLKVLNQDILMSQSLSPVREIIQKGDGGRESVPTSRSGGFYGLQNFRIKGSHANMKSIDGGTLQNGYCLLITNCLKDLNTSIPKEFLQTKNKHSLKVL